MALEILENVRYRIQNVDFGTFLEQRGDSGLVMRPQKDSNKQQWTFGNISGNRDANLPTYVIRNVSYNESFLNAGKLNTATPPTGSVSLHNTSSPVPHLPTAKWKLPPKHDSVNSGGNVFYIVNLGLKNALLRLVDSGGGSPSIERATNIDDIQTISKPEEYQWRILEVSPASLPSGDGKYRIRTLNGDTIHTAGPVPLSIDEQGLSRGEHRAWEIISKGNGKCTLKNVDKDQFLDTEKVGDKWAPCLSLREKEWHIKCDNDFSFAIYVMEKNESRVLSPYAISVDDQAVALKPMKAAHNQIWLIEPTDAPLPQHQQGTAEPREIATDLTEGSYNLYNVGTRKFVSLGPNNALYPNTDNALPIEVKSIERGGKVVIYYTDDDEKQYLALDSGNVLVLKRSHYVWTVERFGRNEFYIRGGNSIYLGVENPVITAKSKGAVNQLWSFKE